MPTTAWAGFPPGPPKPGHFRSDQNESRNVQPNAQTARATFSAWGRRARASSENLIIICLKADLTTNYLRPTECPNGSSDLFRLGSPSQGILFFSARADGRLIIHGARRMPLWLGTDSPPLIRPSRGCLARVEGSGFRV
jgi:hypothetical protein